MKPSLCVVSNWVIKRIYIILIWNIISRSSNLDTPALGIRHQLFDRVNSQGKHMKLVRNTLGKWGLTLDSSNVDDIWCQPFFFFCYSSNSHFSFQNKNKIKIDILTKETWEAFTCTKKSSYNFRWNRKPNCTPFYPTIERQCKFKVKLHDYWTNLHKN